MCVFPTVRFISQFTIKDKGVNRVVRSGKNVDERVNWNESC